MKSGPSPTGILADIAALIDSATEKVVGFSWVPDALVLWLVLDIRDDQVDVDGILNILDAGPLMAIRSGRMVGRQAQTMPRQGSTKESIIAGA